VKERVLLGGAVLLRGRELENVDAVKVPPVRFCHRAQLFLGLRQSDEEHRLALADALHEVLHRHRRLAGAGITLNEVKAVGRQSAVEDVIESADAGAEAGMRPRCLGGLRFAAFTHNRNSFGANDFARHAR
jgi:hypothetical protein